MNPIPIIISKYGKREINKKDRLFIIDDEKIRYFPLPSNKKLKKELTDRQDRINKGESITESLDGEMLKLLQQYINDDNHKSEIPILEAQVADKSELQKHFAIKDKDRISWSLHLSDNEIKFITRIIEEKKNKKTNLERVYKPIIHVEEAQPNKQAPQSNQFEDYKFLQNIEIIYQLLWNDYYKELKDITSQSNNKKYSKLIELELSIEIVQNYFSKYCERLVKLILSYLRQETFRERNILRIIPILYPDLLDCDEKNHYLIYYFFGITITMSWNVIGYKHNKRESIGGTRDNPHISSNQNPRKDSRRIEEIDPSLFNIQLIYGTWSDLKSSFKQSEYTHNNFLYSTSKVDKPKNPRVPLTCLIDYCGFRFLCEYDIFDESQNQNEAQRKETKKVEPASYKKCLELFYELFSMNDNKKLNQNQADTSNITSNNFNSNLNIGATKLNNDNSISKSNIAQEKPIYEKLFDIINDYYVKAENSKEIALETSGQQNKKIYFKEQYDQIISGAFGQNNNLKLNDYLPPKDYDNLLEFPDQNLQQNNDVLFKKKIHFRPELLTMLNEKENFNDPIYRTKIDDNNKKEGISQNNKSNHYQSQKKVERVYREKNLNLFINALDSFHYKIYDSETMAKLFHAYGININSLGQIAEKTESPYIKEFCLIEMLARACKKIVHHLLAEDRMNSFLNFLEPLTKFSVAYDSNQLKTGLLPFKYRKMYYGKEWNYLSSLKEVYLNHIGFSSDQCKFIYNIWITHPSGPKTNTENINNEILNISEADNKKGNKPNDVAEHNKDKKAPTINATDHIKNAKEIIAKFLNVLFGKTKDKISIKGKMYTHKELWKYLNEEIKNYYKIESKEMLVFCKLKCMSIPPFLLALEHHLGIELNWKQVLKEPQNITLSKTVSQKDATMVNNTSTNLKDQHFIYNDCFFPSNLNLNYTNRHLMSITWKPEDVLEIYPKTSLFNFHKFLSNKGKNEEYQCNYSHLIENRNNPSNDALDKYMLLRYYFEKITNSNKFSLWYVMFFNELKLEELSKDIRDSQQPNQQDKNYQLENDSNKEGKIQSASQNKRKECIELYQLIYKDIQSNPNYEFNGLMYKTHQLLNNENNPQLMLDSGNDNDNNNNNSEDGDLSNSIEYEQLSQKQRKKFDRLNYIMLNITKEIQNYDISKVEGLEISLYKTNYAIENTNLKRHYLFYENQAMELISNYYIQTHPYYSDIKQLCGKEFLKKWKTTHQNENLKSKSFSENIDETQSELKLSDKLSDLIENYFKDSIENGLKCLSRNNIYLAHLSLDAGKFYAVRKDYLNAVKIFNWAYLPFKQNNQENQKEYFMYLKCFIKYNIKLGDYKTALLLGDELISESTVFRNDKDQKTAEYLSKHLHLERIVYNLACAALKTHEYDRGIKYCQTIFSDKGVGNYQVSQIASENQNEIGNKKKKSEYVSWISGKVERLSFKGIEGDPAYEIKLKDAEYELKLKLFLKMIIRSLNEDQKVFYLQALLKIYDSADEKKEIKRIGSPTIQQVRKQLEGKGDLNEYFKGKIILALKTKNRDDDNTTEKMNNKEKEQNNDYESFRILYCFFKDKNVFYTFNKIKKGKKTKKHSSSKIINQSN